MYNIYQLSLRAEAYEPRLTRLPYGKLTIVVGEDEEGNEVSYRAIAYGNTSRAPSSDAEYKSTNGQELIIHNPNGTQQMAINIMNQIKGYAYQPYSARNALVPIEAELGDVVRIAGDQSVIATQDFYYDGLAASDIAAPGADETDNEFSLYESKAQKAQVRSDKKLRASFIVELGRIESSLEEDYQKKSDMSRYVETSTLNTSIGQYIDSTAGTAKVVSAASGVYQRKDQMSNYVLSSSLNTSIGQYIDSQAGTAKIIAAASGTYQTKADMSGYVKSSTLDTSIGQYLDSSTGQAKIISAASGTYQTKAAMSGYVTTSSLNTSIGQYIDTQAGQAKIVSAVSGTYQTKSDMANYVQTSRLNSSIEQYIDTTAGTAKITSAVSATYQTKSGMSDYVKTTNLNNSITQYVNSTTGQNTIIASVSGSFAGKSYESRVQLSESKISWLIKSGNNASDFTMTDRAIALTAGSINLSGYVTFSSLSTPGSTSIDGSNIKTDNLYLRKLYAEYPYSSPVLYSDKNAKTMYFGGTENNVGLQYIDIRVSKAVYIRDNYTGNSSYGLEINFTSTDAAVMPYSTNARVSIGRIARPFKNVVTNNLVFTAGSSSDVNTLSYEVATGYGDSGYAIVPSSNFVIGSGTKRINDIYTKSANICGSGYGCNLSFFGATPTAKQTLSTSSANMGYTSATDSNYLVILNNVVGILSKKYGMFAS